ncbi:unnamed protein product [Acanthoscelides obtectus]|uniref:Uncharacterized protein n=1 Tax=Acanthoscelides obtectus TaxID=200917 RepID=A0A9P0KRA7_ACAOB|nr:unnamed protein product [Acanthoscelides obtectus]CAK1652697.1 hypothetical protein AOBTE_LOCUS17894 [Acanthoscelides obtectus]
MQVDSMHATIERRVNRVRINVPADYAYHCKKARKNPKPYEVMYLDHSFFRSFKKVEAIRSIRPGKKLGEPKVTDIRGLKYTPAGDIYYKLRMSDEWELLPQRKSQVDIIAWTELDHLYKDNIPISARKYSDLQEIKCTIPADYHHFYNNLPHL